MRIRLDPTSRFPYLNEKVLKEHSDIRITSYESEVFHINQLLLLAWTRIGRQSNDSNTLIRTVQTQFDLSQDVIISSNFESSDLRVITDFLVKGILPFSHSEVVADKISHKVLHLFQCFGIDLKSILKFILKIEVKDEETFENIKEEFEADTDCHAFDDGSYYSEFDPISVQKDSILKTAIVPRIKAKPVTIPFSIVLSDVLTCKRSELKGVDKVTKFCCSLCEN